MPIQLVHKDWSKAPNRELSSACHPLKQAKSKKLHATWNEPSSEWTHFCKTFYLVTRWKRRLKGALGGKNAIKFKNTCQVWTIFNFFCESFLLARWYGDDDEKRSERHIHWHKACIWFIEIESFLMLFACLHRFLHRILKFLSQFFQLKSFLHEYLPFKLMKHLFGVTFSFTSSAEMHVNYIASHRLPPFSRSTLYGRKKFLVTVSERTWINLINFFLSIMQCQFGSGKTSKNVFMCYQERFFEWIHVPLGTELSYHSGIMAFSLVSWNLIDLPTESFHGRNCIPNSYRLADDSAKPHKTSKRREVFS